MLAWNRLLDATKSEREIGERGRARKRVAALRGIVLRARDLGVVSLDHGGVNVEEGGACVEDASDGRLGAGRANAICRGSDAPPALTVVCVDIGDSASVLGLVNEAEVIASCSMVLQIHSEQGLSKLTQHSVEEGRLLCRLHSVQRAESETEEAISVRVLSEC